jgi:hypothetical protein
MTALETVIESFFRLSWRLLAIVIFPFVLVTEW